MKAKKFISNITFEGITYKEGTVVKNLEFNDDKNDEVNLLKNWVVEVEVADDDNIIEFKRKSLVITKKSKTKNAFEPK